MLWMGGSIHKNELVANPNSQRRSGFHVVDGVEDVNGRFVTFLEALRDPRA